MAEIDWETIAKREGWKAVEKDPNPIDGSDAVGACLYHEDQDRIWTLGDWKGAACDLGYDPETGLYGDEEGEDLVVPMLDDVPAPKF